MAFADLHMHSRASDGICNPGSIAQEACKVEGLQAFALTDHDTLEGLGAAASSAAEHGIAFVPGVEITTKHDERAVHMLGYFVDADDKALNEYLAANKSRRAERVFQMADLMHADGFPVSADALRATSATPNRPLLARLLVDHHCVRDTDEAFRKFLCSGSQYYIDAVYPDTIEAIRLIQGAGGYAFVAHPARYRIVDLIEGLSHEGITGIEAYHSLQTSEQSAELVALADQFGLAVSGGSDWHGDSMHHASLGGCGLDERGFDEFLRACEQA